MNIQDYISSGIIETYVLGLAGEEETRELERLCLEYPEINEALAEAQAAMEEYAQLHAVNPPPDAKSQIWDALNNEREGDKTINTEISPQKNISKIYYYLAIAACLMIAVGLPYHLYMVNQYQSEISTLKKEKLEIIAQNKTFQAQIQKANKEVDIITDPSVTNILLAGTPGHEEKKAFVYWDQSGEVFLNSGTLPSLPDDKQYQLWAIVDGKPVSAGLLEQPKTAQLQKMATVERAQMFAITIEKRGGSEQPTLDQMIVAGENP